MLFRSIEWLISNMRLLLANDYLIVLCMSVLAVYYFKTLVRLCNVRRAAGVALRGGNAYLTDRAVWELKRDNVGVYSIQGRRPHMEDRYNVVTGLQETTTTANASIYGVFDGHGGEVTELFAPQTSRSLDYSPPAWTIRP